MNDPRGIVWLASFPKSGNTWTRFFLANYLFNRDKPVQLNQAYRFAMGDSVIKHYTMVARRQIDARNIDEMLMLRNHVLKGIVANGADVNFVKTHNIYGSIKGSFMIPGQLTRSAVYIVRNPLDVAVSYARHFGYSPAQAVEALANPANWIAPTQNTVAQFLGRWDQHVNSWTKAPHSVLVLRYEDMLADPETAFSKLIAHIGIPVDHARLKKAVKFSSFKELSGQEALGGFEEKSQHTSAFFCKGEADQWKEDLSLELVAKVRADHKEVMEKLGYLDE